MVVYIEYALLENFLIDFTLLFLSEKTVRMKINPFTLVLSALGGTAFAVVFPLLSIPSFWGILLKAAVGVVMCLFSARAKKGRKYIAMIGVFYAYTFLLGGAMFALYGLLGVEYTQGGGIPSGSQFGVVASVAVSFAAFAPFLIRSAYRQVKYIRNRCKCGLLLNGVRVETYAMLDSGNCLTYRGNPVSIVSPAVAAKLMSDFSGKTECAEVEVSTVSGKGKITVFRIDEMQIYSGEEENKIKGAYLGISLFVKGNYPVILNREYMQPGGNV